MGRDRLNESEADAVLSGRRPAGREGHEPLDDLIAVLHASRELEPPPPMSPELSAAVYRRHRAGARQRPAAVPAATAGTSEDGRVSLVDDRSGGSAPAVGEPIAAVRALPRGAKRAVASVAAAAVLLVGVVLASVSGGSERAAPDLPATRLPAAYEKHPVPSQGSTGEPAVSSPVPGETTTAPPTTSSSVATAPPAAPPSTAPADAGVDQDSERRRDRDGDGDSDQREGDWRRRADSADEPDDTAGDRATTDDSGPSTSTTSTSTPSSSTTATTEADAADAESWPGGTTSTTDGWHRYLDGWVRDLFDAFGR
jgi:hypothetical protein